MDGSRADRDIIGARGIMLRALSDSTMRIIQLTKVKKKRIGTMEIPQEQKIPLERIADEIKEHIASTTQKFIEKDAKIKKIPVKELDILCKYFPVAFVTEMFGGNYQIILKDYNNRRKIETAGLGAEAEGAEDENIESTEPYGIGGWQYADRLRIKVFRELEKILNAGLNVAGHSQLVQAAKTLLAEADKSKDDATEVMMAYQTQLLLFAEHIVEIFLPALGNRFKKELHELRDTVVEKIKPALHGDLRNKENKELLELWKKEVSDIVRSFNRHRFELMLAETMTENKALSEAFDFTKDLIENYKHTDVIDRDSKSVSKLKQHIQKRNTR